MAQIVSKRSAVAVAASTSLVLGLAACADGGRGGLSGQTVGAGLGALAGAALGSQFGSGGGQIAATIAGGVIGAIIGSEIGRAMDEVSRQRAQAATQRALESAPTGSVVTWDNPDTGYSGTIEPKAAFVDTRGQTCREFTSTVALDGQTETAVGTACRQPDGTWQLQA